MKLYFYRFAVLTIRKKFEKLPERWHHWQTEFTHSEINSVCLKGFPFQPVGGAVKQLVRAGCELRYFPKIAQSSIVVSEKERQTLEREISHAANLISVGLNSGVTITTPLGLEVAFLPYDDDAKRRMSQVDSILNEQGIGHTLIGY